MNKPITLLIPEKTDFEFEQVFSTWTKSGGEIKRLGKYWVKDEDLAKQKIAIYGNQAFAFVLAQIYNVELLSPDDTLTVRLDPKWTMRNIQLKTVSQLTIADFPIFIKPVVPKMFLAGVFQTMAEFEQVSNGLQKTEEVLVSDVIDNIQAEARSFVINDIIKDIAFYEGSADLESGRNFLTDFISNNKDFLPKAIVIDIAFSEQIGWFILEFNACWGAGLNGCKAENVIECIISATINK
jgi:hypothetical protein